MTCTLLTLNDPNCEALCLCRYLDTYLVGRSYGSVLQSVLPKALYAGVINPGPAGSTCGNSIDSIGFRALPNTAFSPAGPPATLQSFFPRLPQTEPLFTTAFQTTNNLTLFKTSTCFPLKPKAHTTTHTNTQHNNKKCLVNDPPAAVPRLRAPRSLPAPPRPRPPSTRPGPRLLTPRPAPRLLTRPLLPRLLPPKVPACSDRWLPPLRTFPPPPLHLPPTVFRYMPWPQ